jgi:hypothetical protein
MPTTNPKISAYVPQPVYDCFEEFYKSSKLSMSQAATLIFAERFGLEEIVKRITKDTTVDIGVLEEIKELKSRLRKVERQLEELQDSGKLKSDQPFNEQGISEIQSSLISEPINEGELKIDIELDYTNISIDSLHSDLISESLDESTQSTLDLYSLQGELHGGLPASFEGITASALAKRLVGKRSKKAVSPSYLSNRMKMMHSNPQEFFKLISELDRDHVAWDYDEKTGLFTPVVDNLTDEIKIKVSRFMENNSPKRVPKKQRT